MNKDNIEKMKKLIEEKKQKGQNSKNNQKPKKIIGRPLLLKGRSSL